MKAALITGASRGIGRVIAEMMASEGYSLHLTCKNNYDTLADFSEYLKNEYGTEVNIYKTDCSDFNQVTKLFESITELDVLVNNAGISHVGLLHEMDVKEWNDIMNTNLSSAFFACKYAIPLMLKKHEGKIINISSVWGNIGASMEVAYSATKGGINSFTKALAKELAPSNISVNAIACGFVDTEMNAHLTEEERESVKAEIPADRFAESVDIANTVKALLTTPNYLTGQIITVDGGWT